MDDSTEDRRLLQLAAKAAGLPGLEFRPSGICAIKGAHSIGPEWNPLTDDADAFRLAVKLGLTVAVDLTEGCTRILNEFEGVILRHMHFAGGPEAATRRAITRAAAAIGERGERNG